MCSADLGYLILEHDSVQQRCINERRGGHEADVSLPWEPHRSAPMPDRGNPLPKMAPNTVITIAPYSIGAYACLPLRCKRYAVPTLGRKRALLSRTKYLHGTAIRTHTSCTIPYSNTEPTYVGDITTQPPPIHPSKRTVMCTAKRRLICDGHAFNAPPTRARFSCSGGDVKYKFPHFIPSPSCVHQ